LPQGLEVIAQVCFAQSRNDKAQYTTNAIKTYTKT